MPLREFFHLMHMVDDFDKATDRWEALFAPITFMPKSWSNLDKRWASLARVGSDFVWELMEASTDPGDASAPLVKFHQRFGQHLHSLSWLVDEADQRQVVDRLTAGGVRVVGPSGSLVGPDTRSLPHVVFTHPKDTFGQIELMNTGPAGHPTDPLFAEGWSDRFWRDEHPLGIRRTSHITNAVADLDRAKVVFAALLGGEVFHESVDDIASRAYVFVGSQTVVELAQPRAADSLLGRDFARCGELPHAVAYLVRDLRSAVDHARDIGIGVVEMDDRSFTLDPDDVCGAVISFTTAAIPGDPRGSA